jgi:heme A synthase
LRFARVAALVLLQVGLGALTVLSRKDVPLTTAHVANGALLLAATLVMALSSRRSGVPSPAGPVSDPAPSTLSLRQEPAWK